MLGSNFRKIRLERGLTLQEAAAKAVSVASLSKFENEETSLGVRKLTASLHNMNTSFLEYASLCDDSTGNPDSYLFRVVAAYRKPDLATLKLLVDEQAERYKMAGSEIDFNDLISAAGLYCDLSGKNLVGPAELKHLENKLSHVQAWGETEVIVFGNGMTLLNDETVTKLGLDLLAHVDDIHAWNDALYQDAWSALMNVVDLLLARHSDQVDRLFKAIGDCDLPEAIMIDHFRLRFLKDCYAAQKQPTAATVALVQRDIDFLAKVGSKRVHDQYVRSAIRLLGADYPHEEA
ncbi:Rgg family transcriptional regulator [Lacticaseibacillus zhaodongensis]|uniref:Rgg family transcriptional regulator n=1 Tax=Lacticaseibacillus zhaodongensis TaxID=2668065 RepID=UPI0018AFD756|nr:helix-turn-helix domain-containing protein [Lacticaseibacillus zhaodongensis]